MFRSQEGSPSPDNGEGSSRPRRPYGGPGEDPQVLIMGRDPQDLKDLMMDLERDLQDLKDQDIKNKFNMYNL